MSGLLDWLTSIAGQGKDVAPATVQAPLPTADPGSTAPLLPSYDQFRSGYRPQQWGEAFHNGLGSFLGMLMGADNSPQAYNAMLRDVQATKAGQLNTAGYEGLNPGAAGSPAQLKAPAPMLTAPQPATTAGDPTMPAGTPSGLLASLASAQSPGSTPPAPALPVAAPQPAAGGFGPAQVMQRIQRLNFPAGLSAQAPLLTMLDTMIKQGAAVDGAGNITRVPGANATDEQRAAAEAGGAAPYKALEALMAQAGRAVKLEPGDSVTNGFANMPDDIQAAVRRMIAGGGAGAGAAPGATSTPSASGAVSPTGSGPGAGGPGVNSTGFPTQPMRGPGGTLQNPITLEGKTMQTTVLPEAFKEAGANYKSAQNLMGQLDMVDHNIDTLNQTGWSSTGSGANAKLGAIKTLNSVFTSLGKEAPFDPSKIATWEDFNKESTRMGFELAKTLGSREAQMIVQQAVSAVPNAENSYLGARVVSSSLRQAAQRQSDYYEFLNNFAMKHGGNTMGADIAFNQANPAKTYTNRAIVNAVPDGAREILTKNPTPATRAQFDQVFGKGMASRVLLGGGS